MPILVYLSKISQVLDYKISITLLIIIHNVVKRLHSSTANVMIVSK